MSYILDALRRADAERERGVVPGLHAQTDLAELEPAARDRKPLLLAAAGAGALVVAVVAVLVIAPWRGAPSGDTRVAVAREDVREAAAPAQPAAPATTAPPAVVPPLAIATLAPAGSVRHTAIAPPAGTNPDESPSAQRSAGAMPAELPAATRGALPDSRPAASARAPATRGPGNAPDGGPAAGARGDANPQPVPNGQPAPNAQAAAAPAEAVEHYGPPLPAKAAPSAPAPVVKNLNDLPPTLRSQMPRLAVGGAIYSDTPSGRMLILNGQVYHEGDRPAPDTVLELIRLKSAVLNFRGTRYEITY